MMKPWSCRQRSTFLFDYGGEIVQSLCSYDCCTSGETFVINMFTEKKCMWMLMLLLLACHVTDHIKVIPCTVLGVSQCCEFIHCWIWILTFPDQPPHRHQNQQLSTPHHGSNKFWNYLSIAGVVTLWPQAITLCGCVYVLVWGSARKPQFKNKFTNRRENIIFSFNWQVTRNGSKNRTWR